MVVPVKRVCFGIDRLYVIVRIVICSDSVLWVCFEASKIHYEPIQHELVSKRIFRSVTKGCVGYFVKRILDIWPIIDKLGCAVRISSNIATDRTLSINAVHDTNNSVVMQLIEVFSASFLNQLFALATPLLFQQIIDRVISKGAFDALGPLVILMLIFVALETIFSSLRTFQFVEVSNRIDIGVGSAIVSRLLRLNARFFDRRPVGELASRLGELENIRRFLTGTALTVVLDAFFALLYFAVMFFYSPLLTMVILLTLPLLFGVTLGVTPITQRLIRARAEAASRTQSLLVEILGGIQTVKLQNAELTARRQWEDRHLNSINQGFKAVLANTTSSNALQLINKISSILVIGIGAWLVLRNELTLGQLIAFRIISSYVTQPVLRLASSWQSFQELFLSLERVGDVVNQPLEIGEAEEANVVMPTLVGKISASELSSSYS